MTIGRIDPCPRCDRDTKWCCDGPGCADSVTHALPPWWIMVELASDGPAALTQRHYCSPRCHDLDKP